VLISPRHGSSSGKLHEVVAALCQLLCNSIVPWDNIRALLASCLIALDKCPGVWPIGVGETLRRIVVKTICLITCCCGLWKVSIVCWATEWY